MTSYDLIIPHIPPCLEAALSLSLPLSHKASSRPPHASFERVGQHQRHQQQYRHSSSAVVPTTSIVEINQEDYFQIAVGKLLLCMKESEEKSFFSSLRKARLQVLSPFLSPFLSPSYPHRIDS